MSILKIGGAGVSAFLPEVTLSSKNAQVSASAIDLQFSSGGAAVSAYTLFGNTNAGPTTSFPTSSNWMKVTATGHGLSVGDLFTVSAVTVTTGITNNIFVVYGWVDANNVIAYCTLSGTPTLTSSKLEPVYLPGYSNLITTTGSPYTTVPTNITGFTGFANYLFTTAGMMPYVNTTASVSQYIQTYGTTTPTSNPTLRTYATATASAGLVWFDGQGQCFLKAQSTGATTYLDMVS